MYANILIQRIFDNEFDQNLFCPTDIQFPVTSFLLLIDANKGLMFQMYLLYLTHFGLETLNG